MLLILAQGTINEIAERFDYTPASPRILINRILRQNQRLFHIVKKGPKGRRTPPETVKLIVKLRRRTNLERGISKQETIK